MTHSHSPPPLHQKSVSHTLKTISIKTTRFDKPSISNINNFNCCCSISIVTTEIVDIRLLLTYKNGNIIWFHPVRVILEGFPFGSHPASLARPCCWTSLGASPLRLCCCARLCTNDTSFFMSWFPVWGGAGVWGVYRNYELVDVRLTYFKVCILSSCERGEGCSQSWLKDVRKSTWTSVRCLELWIIWQKNKTPFSRQRHVGWVMAQLDAFTSG